MNSDAKSIQQDTSNQKYPFSKYYNYPDLHAVTKKVFDNHSHATTTIDSRSIPIKHSHCASNKPRPSQRALRKNTMNINRANSSGLNPKATISSSITLDNYKDFNKQQIAQQLHHYKNLCLTLRKDNQQLKGELADSKNSNKQTLVQLQKKVNKLNERNLQIKQKQLNEQQNKLNKTKQKIQTNRETATVKQRDGEFKRFFLHFLDNYGRIDDKLGRKVATQKSIQKKLVLGQRMLRQGCEYLKEKKYKFNCIFD